MTSEKYTDLCRLYNQCLPQLAVDENSFIEKLLLPDVKIISNDYGFVLVNKNMISMLCIDPKYQKQGYGSELLRRAESEISNKNYDKIILGQHLLPGAPVESSEFFIKRGYKHSWGNVSCLDLTLDLSTVDVVHNVIDGINYRSANDNDLSKLIDAVTSVDKNWAQYYNKISDNIIIADKDGQIAGFVILDENIKFSPAFKGKRVGGFGAIGVLHRYRKLHIGFNMVRICNSELKKRGFDISYCAYTYLDGFYKSLGFMPYAHYFMGVKELITAK
jgi:N-acetylglutamate synthase-like GNAT family acetyltransferase